MSKSGDASAGAISRKFRRALRNNTGTKFTASELRLMADLGLLRLLLEAEENELRERWQRHATATSEASGSTDRRRDAPGARKPLGLTPEQERRGAYLRVNRVLSERDPKPRGDSSGS